MATVLDKVLKRALAIDGQDYTLILDPQQMRLVPKGKRKAAVELAVKGKNSVMPTVERVSSKPYKWKVGVAPLNKVANVEKMMPKDFITDDGFGITAKCRTYLEPLIQGEDYPPYKNGMPQYVRLKNVAAKKKLGEFKL